MTSPMYVSVGKAQSTTDGDQIATKSNLEIMNQRKYRGDPDWTGIDCVSRWLINLVSMLVVNSEYIRNTVDTDISTVYSLIWYNLDE